MESATHIPPDHGSVKPQSDPRLGESLKRGHEQRDASFRAIVIFVVVLAASIVVIQLAVWGLDDFLKHRESAHEPQKMSSVALPLGRPIPPPEPRLQPSPSHPSLDHDDWQTLLGRWNRQLTSYGKVEGDPDRARIPIQRAMEMAEEKGIDAVKAAPVAAPPTAGASSSQER